MMTSSPGSMKAMNALNMPKRKIEEMKLEIRNHDTLLVFESHGNGRGQVLKMADARTFISASGDGDFSLGVNRSPPKGRVGIGNCLFQPRTALGGRVLIAVDAVQRLLGRIEDEIGRVVAKEALAHVDNGLSGRSGGCFVDDGPISQIRLTIPAF